MAHAFFAGIFPLKTGEKPEKRRHNGQKVFHIAYKMHKRRSKNGACPVQESKIREIVLTGAVNML